MHTLVSGSVSFAHPVTLLPFLSGDRRRRLRRRPLLLLPLAPRLPLLLLPSVLLRPRHLARHQGDGILLKVGSYLRSDNPCGDSTIISNSTFDEFPFFTGLVGGVSDGVRISCPKMDKLAKEPEKLSTHLFPVVSP